MCRSEKETSLWWTLGADGRVIAKKRCAKKTHWIRLSPNIVFNFGLRGKLLTC